MSQTRTRSKYFATSLEPIPCLFVSARLLDQGLKAGTPLSVEIHASKVEDRVVQLKTSLCNLPRLDVMANLLAFLAVFAAMASASVNQTDDRQLQTTDASFCWKTTHTRGVGQVP
ncbi:hypothetical protein AaE_002756, partial [Aphanomyces astaci]